jgi:hypothetical protein
MKGDYEEFMGICAARKQSQTKPIWLTTKGSRNRCHKTQCPGLESNLSAPPKIHQKKTGTDDATADENVLALRLALKSELR